MELALPFAGIVTRIPDASCIGPLCSIQGTFFWLKQNRKGLATEVPSIGHFTAGNADGAAMMQLNQYRINLSATTAGKIVASNKKIRKLEASQSDA